MSSALFTAFFSPSHPRCSCKCVTKFDFQRFKRFRNMKSLSSPDPFLFCWGRFYCTRCLQFADCAIKLHFMQLFISGKGKVLYEMKMENRPFRLPPPWLLCAKIHIFSFGLEMTIKFKNVMMLTYC